MNIAMIGCGLIGTKRSKYFDYKNNNILFVDTDFNASYKLKTLYPRSRFIDNIESIQSMRYLENIDIAFVATPNKFLFPIGKKCIENKIPVLLEKPGGKTTKELGDLLNLSIKNNVSVQIGFNLRYHPAVIKAKSLITGNLIGNPQYILARYAHGGRLGYNKEWRASKDIAGGGVLIDLGIHLLDLSGFFLRSYGLQFGYSNINGLTKNSFWNTDVEDTAFLNMRTTNNIICSLSVSCAEWKNIFDFQIIGTKGKLKITGIGGSYGTETLSVYTMNTDIMGVPEETTHIEYPQEDLSFKLEQEYFLKLYHGNVSDISTLRDAYNSMAIIEEIYTKGNQS